MPGPLSLRERVRVRAAVHGRPSPVVRRNPLRRPSSVVRRSSAVRRPSSVVLHRTDQQVLSFAERDLTDYAHQRNVARDAQLGVQSARGGPRTKLPQVHAVIHHADLPGLQPLGLVEAGRGLRNGQQPPVTVEIGDRRGAEPDDIPQVGDAGQARLGRQGPGQAAHRQAVGVQEVRPAAAHQRRQLLGERPPGAGGGPVRRG